jgi:hypothetical protein
MKSSNLFIISSVDVDIVLAFLQIIYLFSEVNIIRIPPKNYSHIL